MDSNHLFLYKGDFKLINGYVTYDELKIITGYSDSTLKKLLIDGLSYHELGIQVESDRRYTKSLEQHLFDLQEVENWLKVHVY